MKQLLLTLTALAISAFTLQAGEAEFPDIDKETLKKAIESNEVVLIDVNGSASYKAGHIPGAIDFEANKGNLAAALPEDKNTLIVAYCGNKYCGAYKMAAKAAKDLGYTNVKHYSAGIQGWKAEGEKTESAS